MSDEPQIIELDPEGAPRMTAIILLVCGLMGVGFLLVNVAFTGEDPYATMEWPEEDGTIQEQGNITPNLWRNRGNDDEEEEVEEKVKERKNEQGKKKPATRPGYGVPGLPNPLNRPGMPAVPGAPGTGGGTGSAPAKGSDSTGVGVGR
jgi:hypothetical protein